MNHTQDHLDSTGWVLGAIGNCTGTARTGMHDFRVRSCEFTPLPCSDLQMIAEGGKFADSEDSFLFVFRILDPNCQNFHVSALLDADTTDQDSDQQSGFGILLADTSASPDSSARHRNHVLLGMSGRDRTCGVRIVAGYTDPDAVHPESRRILDQSRSFTNAPKGFPVHRLRLEVEKNDLGILFTCGDESMFLPGCDFLMHQAPQEISVGFAAARGVSVHITDTHFQVTPGKASTTPDAEIMNRPGTPPLFWERLKTSPSTGPCSEDLELYVSPDAGPAGDGSERDPMRLEKAIAHAGAGTVMHLSDGVYMLREPCVIRPHQSGTPLRPVRLLAHTPRQVILDGSALSSDTPAWILAADFWHIHGVVFRNAPLSGLLISGHGCRIDDCEADACGDTGILIQAAPDTPGKDWPSYNEILHCDSHDNCDLFHTNADGFGAKLRSGPGNLFYDCAAYRNCDDGFDLYTKSTLGPTGPVVLDRCIAIENGQYPLNAQTVRRKTGIGFKLGGENICVRHTLWHCIAFQNAGEGFSGNSNPGCILHGCMSSGNMAEQQQRRFYHKPPFDTRQVRELATLPQELQCIQTPLRNESRTLWFPESMTWNSGKKILIMVSSLGGGGAERVACRLANTLSETHEVSLLYSSDAKKPYPICDKVSLLRDSVPEPLPDRNRVLRSILHRIAVPYRLLKLYTLKKDRHIDTTISLLEYPNLKNALVPGGKRIMSERNDPSHKPVSYQRHARFSYALADFTVFQTEKVRQMFSRRIRRKSCVILNPVAVEWEALPERRKKIVSAGRLHPQKNQDLLIRAFALFHLRHPEYELFLYGTGPLQSALEATIQELGISDCAHIVPFTLNLHEEIRDAEMFVLSSDYEGLSNALMEAMCMGIACISTDCTGSPELLGHGDFGLLTPVGDRQALCDAMCRLSEDEELRRKLELHARRRSMAFQPERILREWERIL